MLIKFKNKLSITRLPPMPTDDHVSFHLRESLQRGLQHLLPIEFSRPEYSVYVTTRHFVCTSGHLYIVTIFASSMVGFQGSCFQ